ncbi:MAG: glycosyltransferase family 4 protein [Desulfomonile tiedjei]|nr:glycosyltransferase family 4 protein [Desulfomonile tiedjei]
MRVLHLIHSFNRGGVEKWLIDILQEMPRELCEIDFCCKGADPGPWAPLARERGARIHHCPLTIFHVGFLSGLGGILRGGEYDLVHSHLGIYSGLAVRMANRAGVPIVTTFHSSLFPPGVRIFTAPGLSWLRNLYGRISIAYAIRHSDHLTAVSRGVLDEVVPDEPALRAKSSVSYLGLKFPPPAAEREKLAFRQSLGWPGDVPLVIHVGRFYHQKNHFGLLKVFQLVLGQLPRAKLVMLGVGPLLEGVKAYVAEHGLVESVRFLGPTDDAASVIAKADVLLFPSRFEGFGLVALEANAVEVPVVGSNVVGLNEAVENGETACLWDVDDTRSMAASVIRILSDPAYARQLGEAGRARAERLFSAKASAERLIHLYRTVLGKANEKEAKGAH